MFYMTTNYCFRKTYRFIPPFRHFLRGSFTFILTERLLSYMSLLLFTIIEKTTHSRFKMHIHYAIVNININLNSHIVTEHCQSFI